MSFPTPWYVSVEAICRSHLDLPHVIDSRSRQRRVARFRHQFAARDEAARLGKMTALELYKWVVIRGLNAGAALRDAKDLLPLNSELIEANIEWGSRGAAGKTHGTVTIPNANEVGAMQEP